MNEKKHDMDFCVSGTQHFVSIKIGEDLKNEACPAMRVVLSKKSESEEVNITHTVWEWQKFFNLNEGDLKYLKDVLPGMLEIAGIPWSK